MKLFHRFFLILLAFSMLPVAGLGLWMISAQRAVQDNARTLHGRLAALVSDSAERMVDQLNRTLAVVEDIERGRGNPQMESAALRRAAASDPEVALVSVLDPFGMETQRLADPDLFPGPPQDRSADAVVTETRRTGKVTIGAPLVVSRRTLVPVAHPVSDGRFLYMLYSLGGLERRLNRMPKGGGGRILFVDAAGHPVPGLGDDPPAPGWSLPENGADEGWWDRLPSPDGPWVAASSRLPTLRWRAVSLQLRREAYAESEAAAARAASFFALLCVLVAGGAYALSDRLVRPISLLIAGAERVAHGDFGRPIPALGWGELEGLGRTFNAMAQKIRHYQELQVEKIMEEKAKVDALVRNIPEGVLLAGFDGSIIFANSTASRVLGLNDRVTRVSELVRTPQIQQLVGSIQGGAKRAEGELLEIRSLDGKSSTFFSSQALTVVREGRDVGILVLLHDVTVERELENMKDEFFHAVVHDLRGPITVIDGMVHAMKAIATLGTREKRYVELAEQASDRLSGLVTNILDIAKLESGTMKLALAEVAPKSLLEPVRDLTRLPAENKGIVVELESSASGMIEGDAKLLERVLMNLTGNALKFTPSGGRIVLTAADAGDEVEFSVRDTGPGIPADKLDAVFEKFKQLDRDAAVRAGYGLGLSICKKIVELHGGVIWVESKEGQGSRFAFRLPRKVSA